MHGPAAGSPPVLPSGKMVMWALAQVMSRPGNTISEVEAARGRTCGRGDRTQRSYEHASVWHGSGKAVEQVANILNLDRDAVLGGGILAVDFYQSVMAQISALRARGCIADWRAGGRLGVFRLADPSRLPAIDPDGLRPPSHAETSPDTSHAGLTKSFLSILSHGSKANTYKFALARAILEHCRGGYRNAGPDEGESILRIPYEYLADKFLRYYWHQEYVLHMRQNYDTKHVPHAITKIRGVFGEGTPGDYSHLDKKDVERARKLILRNVFGHARSKTSIVVPRFQKIPVGNRTVEVRSFYDYDDDEQAIKLRPEAFEFFQKNYALLSKAVLIEWTKFLEPLNPTLPRLLTKIESMSAERQSLTKYHNMFAPFTDCCFYCRDRLEPGYVQVDHLIPWTYIYDDNAWNLVLACQSCNCKKSNSLPEDEFRDGLVERNHRHRGEIPPLRASLDMLDRGRGWEAEIHSHYQTCLEYGFGTIRLP
ncbi:MAG: HNH endonuclease [Thaumarchaeota archaeon]|nr:HNH endonuclease [Nitrososphaerota archaeon]MDE0266725.1 HNH endonuclease [Nitrososphaerota archaeon]MDE0526539.1 HNH endonuclease [Nitrososphaerota archaeon]